MELLTTQEKELIKEATQRLDEIVKASESIPQGKYLAIYESEEGYTIDYIQEDWHTRTNLIRFGTRRQTREQVNQTIIRYQLPY